MPLTRRDGSSPIPPADPTPTSRPDPSSPDPEARRAATRLLPPNPESAGPLGRMLAHERDGSVREAILTALARIGGDAAVAALLPHLRSDDAALRSAALTTLQGLPATLAQLPALLADEDPDIRVLAAEIARAMPAGEAAALLCGMIAREREPNPCAAAVEVLAEIGGPDCLPVLEACAGRFASEPFLGFAIRAASARISGGRAPATR
ncbi:HEAT repeat domain-containing protein [Rubellimicrobium arenae]|uniref:HEAT repeat domain-containing protein n=1 Tax=Rubellimicrobium arenae TaxID=2817372 RepID=UPI001B30A73C|nr:HEAT repeat domain-containing protein [Rubellimicrobium arenae]